MSTFLTENVAGEFATQRLNQSPVNVIDIIKSFNILRDCTIYEGKVSTCISGGSLVAQDGTLLRIMIRTPRISTHDVKRGEIPFKDQVLAINHNFMRKRLACKPMIHAQLDELIFPDNSIVSVSEDCEPIKAEFVVREYNAYTTTSTSLYQHYMKGERTFCRHKLPNNLVPNGKLPYIMDTPSTKDVHDLSVSPDYLFENGICDEVQYTIISGTACNSFLRISRFLAQKNIILADTKLEFGISRREGGPVVIDEVFSMDSSRFWPKANWKQSLDKHEAVLSWSKEFARGLSKGDSSYISDEQVQIAVKYMLGIQQLTEQPFVPNMVPIEEQIVTSIKSILDFYFIK